MNDIYSKTQRGADARIVHAYRTTQKSAANDAADRLKRYYSDHDAESVSGYNISLTITADGITVKNAAELKAMGITPDAGRITIDAADLFKVKHGSITLNIK